MSAKERVEIELKELNEKIDKLDTFIKTNRVWQTLSMQMQSLMLMQLDVMKQYSTLLTQRLAIWAD